MFFYKFFGNKKANAESRVSLFFFAFCTVKTLKYFFLFFLINSNAIIFYAKSDLLIFCLMYPYIYLLTTRRIFNSICQQIDHHLSYPVFISKYIRLKIVIQTDLVFSVCIKDIFNSFNRQLVQ